jgi:hypothetical protein
VLPEPERDRKRIDVELVPPCGLLTRAMKLAVMDAANRDGELVADSVCFSAAAFSENDQGSMNLASKTAPLPSTMPSRVAPIHRSTVAARPGLKVSDEFTVPLCRHLVVPW